jgi:hypothetical protein
MLLCNVQWKNFAIEEVGGSAGHSRLDDSENIGCDGASPRLWHRPANRAVERGCVAVYTSLLRLQQQGWIRASWGASENNRRAKFYSVTKSGRRQLVEETENWERISGVIGRVLAAREQ